MALVLAEPSDTVWVAQGSYTQGSNRLDSFELKPGVSLYGGFPTGGGNKSSIGGGGAASSIQSSPDFLSCTFKRNEAIGFGGAIYTRGFASNLLNCIFVGNKAQLGGAVYVEQATRVFTNCVFQGNAADFGGGAVVLDQSDSQFINCTISGNKARDGGAIFAALFSNPVLKNTIIWNNEAGEVIDSISASVNKDGDSNPTYEYCLIANSGGSQNWSIELGIDGGNNLDADPSFVAPINLFNVPSEEGDLRLREDSPALDKGDNNAEFAIVGGISEINAVLFDIAGNGRILMGTQPGFSSSA